MILVTGATGFYGKATIDYLLKKGVPSNNISALVRNKTKADELSSKNIKLKIGDYDNLQSLIDAFAGVDKLLFVSSNDFIKRGKQHENVLNAAKEAGVGHIVYTSFQRKNETETSPVAMVADVHIKTENIIKSSGIPYTILQNTIYADMLPMFLGEKVAETGVFFPAGEGKNAFALRNDMAEATAEVLIGDNHKNKVYVFCNTENVTFSQIAEIFSGIFGKTVPYTSPDKEVYIETHSKMGFPKEMSAMFVAFAQAMKEGEFEVTNTDMEKILGRKPISVKEYLTQLYKK